uniref:Cyanate lyase C-terminal domain-containing protein n=1 Tax=Globodera rostochiensis TaxID=31243 RepID=A0A914HV45_GLORO
MANIPSAQLLSASIKSRHEVIEQIYAQKVRLGLRWADVAAQIGLSKEWTTAACLGQMQMNAEEADKLGSTVLPADPLLYRFNEVLSVYGPALKELIHEEFGDGIMSAIDFKVDVQREEDAERGDRVKIVWSGKFLSYNRF